MIGSPRLAGEGPAGVVGAHADVGVVGAGGGGGEEDEQRVFTGVVVGEADELFADTEALMCGVDGEVREVRAVGEVGDGAGDADEGSGAG